MIFLRLFEPLGADFLVYFEAARTILAGGNPYRWTLFGAVPYNYPPTSLLFLWPLGLLPPFVASQIWNVLSVSAEVLAIFFILKTAGAKVTVLGFIFLVLAFTIFFFPAKFNLGMGQINNFVLLLSVLCLYFYPKHKSLSAFFLAAAVAIKIAPVIFLLYFVIRDDWAQVRRFLASLAILVFGSLFVVPFDWQWDFFGNILPVSFAIGAKSWYYNQSLFGFLARSLSHAVIVQVTFYFLAAVIVFLTWWRGRKVSDLRLVAAVATLYLLIHPIAFQHYFAFAIIPLIFLGLNRWTLIAYILIAMDIKRPDLVSREMNFLLSHQFFGVLLLWASSLRIVKYVWVGAGLLFYALVLINTGLSR